MSEKPADLIKEFISLRDQRTDADRKYADWRKEHYDDRMEEIKDILLIKFDELGSESIKTRYGTAYRKTDVSVTIADGELFRNYVIETEKWELADWRANRTAVNDIVSAGLPIPPGVNRSTFANVSINKPKEAHNG
jgi:hypothetical protein